ncbi:MAG TPA: DUF4258 domain-containing protein [Campylobacterales bacterium]|nr:DUF4258 domain-containing protein [Campylobacterales bacterium]
MNKAKIIEALNLGNLEWRKHALERMLERDISRVEVKDTLHYGEIIENYETDTPFPSALFFYIKTKAIHVVASLDEETTTIFIITAYVPDTKHFCDDLKRRR